MRKIWLRKIPRKIKSPLKFTLCLIILVVLPLPLLNGYRESKVYYYETMQCEMQSPRLGTKRNVFQNVRGTYVYVYSAYLDQRGSGDDKIRIIGIGPRNSDFLHCQFHYERGDVVSAPAEGVITLHDEEVQEGEGYYWKPYMFSCNVTRSRYLKHMSVPSKLERFKCLNILKGMVSLTAIPCETPSNLLEAAIVDTNKHRTLESAGLCLWTLSGVNYPNKLIEFIEIHLSLGVRHVYVYNIDNVSSSIKSLLQYYVHKGVLSLVPWQLPINQNQIDSFATSVINNDCLYRAMSVSDHEIMFFHELDEYLTPRIPGLNKIHQVLQTVHEHKNFNLHDTYAAYSFYECTFCMNKQTHDQLLTLTFTKRQTCLKMETDALWWHDVVTLKKRQLASRKSIVHPMRVVSMGTHWVISVLPPYKREIKVPTYYATFQHFKENEYDCTNTDNIMVDRYKSYLKERITTVSKKLGLNVV